MTSLYDFSATSIAGVPQDLSAYRGQVVLVVNTASACGFTPQLKGLQQLYQRYADKGLVVLGFPCNQFGSQESGSHAEIATFCERNYGVDFPLMEKIEVNGAQAHPLFAWLKAEAPGLLGSQMIKWNFTKFLIGRDGLVRGRYAPKTGADGIEPAIVQALSEPVPGQVAG